MEKGRLSLFRKFNSKLKDDAPQWVVDSYNHYMQQLREEFSDGERDDEKEEYVDKL